MRKPVYLAWVTQETWPDSSGIKTTYWTKVGVAFAHNGKPGLNVVLTPGIAVSGKLVLLEPRDDSGTAAENQPVNGEPGATT